MMGGAMGGAVGGEKGGERAVDQEMLVEEPTACDAADGQAGVKRWGITV